MPLPFSHHEFLAVFAAYNAAVWPAALALWLASAWALHRLYSRGASASRILAMLLALQWAWGAVAYHLVFFRAINPAASLFGIAFLVQAGILLWRGVLQDHLRFTPSRSPRGWLAAALLGYGLLYPGIGLVLGLRYPALPTFGVPCPTTLLTAGALLLASPRTARVASVVPIAWAAVGGSAAVLLGMTADLALPVAGAALVVHLLRGGARNGGGVVR